MYRNFPGQAQELLVNRTLLKDVLGAEEDAQKWCLGQEWDGGPRMSDFFDGLIDEVRFWDHARSAEQIAENYEQSVPIDSEGLVAYYKFDQPDKDDARSYQNAMDSTANGNNGRYRPLLYRP